MNTTLNKLLAGILVMQVMIFAVMWKGSTPAYADQAAHPELPDSIPDLRAIQVEMKALNGKMDTLLDLLSSGNLQVQVKGADEAKVGK